MEESKTLFYQDAIKKGLVLGFIHILIFLVLYILFPSKLTGFSYVFIILAVNLGYGIYQGIKYRNSIGGFIGFGIAFQYALIILVVNGLLNTIFLVIFLFLDPSLPDAMAQSQLDTSIYWAQKFGAPDEAIDGIQEKFNPEDVTKRYAPLGLLSGFGIALIFYAIGASIIGLFVKKNQPETF